MAKAHKQVIVKKGFQILISQDQVEAHIRLIGTKDEQQAISVESVLSALKESGINSFIILDSVREFVENKKNLAKKHVLIAKGEAPLKGIDAKIEYKFDTKIKKVPKTDDKGNVNYKELNYIQNTFAGQLLAKKTPATDGKAGKSVFDEVLAVPRGIDVRLSKGQHTEISEDELSLTALVDGAIIYKNGNVSVHPNQKISGSVDSSIGNIECIGSIKIVKNICTDFKVITAGDLDVGGFVEDAIVEAKGNINIKGGFYGEGKGHIKAGGDVFIKFAENQNIEAGKSVYIKGEVLNCNIKAGECVYVTGKSANIVGGVVKAKYLIFADNLGNEAGVPTHVHVAGDAEIVKKLRKNKEEVERLKEDAERVKEAMIVMYKLEMNGSLPPEKKVILDKLKEFKKNLPDQLNALKKEEEEFEEKRKEIADARVAIRQNVHSGSVIHFDPIYREIMNDMYDGVVFSCGDGIIGIKAYDKNTQAELDRISKRIEENLINQNKEKESIESEQSQKIPEKAVLA